jgi:hypothetical protein
MTSFKKLQDLVQTARLVARDNASGLDAVHVSIYDLAMHAFMSDVLTLARITSVVQAVQNGIEACTSQASDTDASSQAIFEREAYRGLCTAATEGLTAVGLAQAEFCNFSGKRLSPEFSKALWQETIACKQELDQITILADWSENIRITRIQTHWFDQILQHIEERHPKHGNISAMPWSHLFFQSCGYEAKTEKNDVQATLMLLGLISSGTLIGLQASYAST